MDRGAIPEGEALEVKSAARSRTAELDASE